MNKLLPLLTTLAQIARPRRVGAAVLFAILAAVLFAGPSARAQNDVVFPAVGLAQVGVGVSAHLYSEMGGISNEAWQWQRSATEAGTYSDIPAADGGASNPYTPSADDLESWPETDRIMARGYTPGNQG